ncbi:MAG: malectin domain-containing carbohydrate-binding protein [Bacteriovoracia bacterium]
MFRSCLALALFFCSTFAHADSPIAIGAGTVVANGNYTADQYFSGGTPYTTGIPINASQVTNPAPLAVYQTCRYGNFSYAIPGLEAGAAHLVRLHFAELYHTTGGSRIFNIGINGSQVLTNFDIVGATGGIGIATVREFTVNANPSGVINLNFASVVGDALVNGIEILPGYQPHPVPTPTYNLILSADQPSYAVGAKATVLLTTRNGPTNSNFEFYVSASFAGSDLPLTRITDSQSYGTTSPLVAGDQEFVASLFLQNKKEAKSLNDAINFYVAEITRLTTALGNTTNPTEIAAIQAEIDRNQALLNSTRAHLAEVRTPVGQPVSITLTAQ